MKQLTLALAVAGLAATATVAFAGPQAATGINGSWHDLNAAAGYTGDSLGRTCVFCHTPHNARTTDALVPLWNHADNVLKNLAPYSWVAPTNQKIAINSDPLIGPSRLCMACHDGSTAVDSHGSAGSFPAGNTKMTASYTDALGATAKRYITDLTVTHPIGFQYDEAAAKRNNIASAGQAVAEIVESSHGFILGDLPDAAVWNTQNRTGNSAVAETGKKIKDTLYGGFMTCATCHDVHNSVNQGPTAASGHSYNYFLYAKEEGSAICLSCHIK
ncbi:cytochrome c3 family protein [Geomesophilobacter sediminis]|uniref:Cytochrome C n=1 Tax=Geomesophilobacter sediminis TaxID=2798584 RepID=A0A8J7JG35_9BACT|nr:cytochrome c3 family protein [Geomesophilobacter sediminis]MBJ6725484.1 cytochrome C [Geomesophilobacter sediminis]